MDLDDIMKLNTNQGLTFRKVNVPPTPHPNQSDSKISETAVPDKTVQTVIQTSASNLQHDTALDSSGTNKSTDSNTESLSVSKDNKRKTPDVGIQRHVRRKTKENENDDSNQSNIDSTHITGMEAEDSVLPLVGTEDITNPRPSPRHPFDPSSTIVGCDRLMPEFKNLSSILDVSDTEAKICFDWIDATVPKNIADKVSKLSKVQLLNALSFNVSILNGLFREDFIRSINVASKLDHKIRQEKDLECQRLKGEISEMSNKISSLLDNCNISKNEALKALEDRKKAETELEEVRSKALKDLEMNQKSLAEVKSLLEESVSNKNRYQADFEKLRTSIPLIFKKALNSKAVTDPFNRLLEATMKVGSMEMINALSNHVTIPDPLPDDVEKLVDADCYVKQKAGAMEMKSLTVPYIEEIGNLSSLSLDEILAMEP